MAGITILVSNSNELNAALRDATGGERIELAANAEGYSLSIRNYLSATSEVVITSADPENPANFTWLNIQTAQNWTFDGLSFVATPEHVAARNWANKDISVFGGENIIIRNSMMEGYAEGIGGLGTDGNSLMHVRNSTNVTIENNHISNYFQGIALQTVSDVLIRNNEITQMQGDGIRMVELDGVTIDGNYIHDFLGSTNQRNHDDMIQLWSTGAEETSRGLRIVNNVLDAGDGVGTQSIFLGNEKTRGENPDPFWNYQDFVIENNTIYNGHLHGITTGSIDGMRVFMNTLIRTENPVVTFDGQGIGPVYTPSVRTNEDSPEVMIVDNNSPISVQNDHGIALGNGSGAVGANTKMMGALDAGWTRSTRDDSADEFNWQTREIVKTETGARAQIEIVSDKGGSKLVTYDVDDEFDFKLQRTIKNETGELVQHVVEFDDGSTLNIRIDAKDKSSLTLQSGLRDADGDLLFKRQIFDDGRVREFHYENGIRTEKTMTDHWDRHDWESKTTYYDENGAVESRILVPDDLFAG